MKLSDQVIKKLINQGKLIINPKPSSNRISGVTVDIRLGNKFRTFNNKKQSFINLGQSKNKNSLNNIMNKEIVLSKKEFFFLKPGELVLAITLESFILPNNLVGWLDGRSSLARLGLMVHITSHRIDPGWNGSIVLECYNAGKITLALQPKMFICALSFDLIYGKVKKPYNFRKNAKYNNQNKVHVSRFDQEQKNIMDNEII